MQTGHPPDASRSLADEPEDEPPYGDLHAFSNPDLDDIAVAAAALCRTPIALISLLDQNLLWFSARVGLDLPFGPLAHSGCAKIVALKAPVVIPDMQADPQTRENALVCDSPGLRFYAGFPLFNQHGTIIGSLCVVDLVVRGAGLSALEHKGLAALARQSMRLMEVRREAIAQDRRLAAQHLSNQQTAEPARDADLDRRRVLEKHALHQASGATSGIGIYELDFATGRITVSPEVCRIAGLPLSPTISAEQWVSLMHPDDRERAPSLAGLIDGSAPLRLQYRILRTNDGKECWVLRQGILDRDDSGRPVRLVGTIQDISPERNTTARLTTLLAIGDALRTAESRQQALEDSCMLMGNRLGIERVGFARITTREELFIVEQSWCAPDIPPFSGSFPFQDFQHTSDFLRGGSVFVLDDITRTSWMRAEQAGYGSVQVVGQVVVPKMTGEDLTGCLFVHSARPREWTLDETSFIRAAADRIFAALDEWDATARQEIINHEILHRLKNTLGIVQSLAHQSFRRDTDQAALATFSARLVALSAAHDLLMKKNWRFTDLASLVTGVLTPLGLETRVAANGPFVSLGPNAATSFSMLLHELATNALKHGAFSVPEGSVSLQWHLQRHGTDTVISLVWQEAGGPPVTTPTRTGFGVRLLKAGLGYHGGTKLQYDPAGLRAELTIPAQAMAAD